MTDSRRTLLNELTEIQNHEMHWNRDLMTITGFMSDEEVRQHIARWQEPPAAWLARQPKKRRAA